MQQEKFNRFKAVNHLEKLEGQDYDFGDKIWILHDNKGVELHCHRINMSHTIVDEYPAGWPYNESGKRIDPKIIRRTTFDYIFLGYVGEGNQRNKVLEFKVPNKTQFYYLTKEDLIRSLF